MKQYSHCYIHGTLLMTIANVIFYLFTFSRQQQQQKSESKESSEKEILV